MQCDSGGAVAGRLLPSTSAVSPGCCCSCWGKTSGCGIAVVPPVGVSRQRQRQQGQTCGCILLDEERIRISGGGRRMEGHPCQADVVGRPHTVACVRLRASVSPLSFASRMITLPSTLPQCVRFFIIQSLFFTI